MHIKYKKVFAASSIVFILGFFGNLIGLFKEQWIASRFGISNELDIFIISQVISTYLTTLTGSGVNAVIIPAYIKAEENGEEEKFLSDGGNLFIIYFIILTIISGTSSWFSLKYFASGFDNEKLLIAKITALTLAPTILLQCTIALVDGILNAKAQYKSAAFSSALIPIGTIIILLFFPDNKAWVLCIGLYLGLIAKLLIQFIAAPKIVSLILKPNYIKAINKFGGYKKISAEFFAIMFSSAILGLLPAISQAFSATLEAGSVSSFNYANKLINIGLTLISGVINAIFFPILARRTIADKKNGVQLALTWIKITLAISFISLIPIYLLLEPAVKTIFERGDFSAKNTSQVVYLMQYLLPHVPFYISGLLLARVVLTLGISSVFITGNIISLLVFCASSWILIKHFGIAAVGISLTTVYIISFIYLYSAIIWKIKK